MERSYDVRARLRAQLAHFQASRSSTGTRERRGAAELSLCQLSEAARKPKGQQPGSCRLEASDAPLKSWTFWRFALSQSACRSHSSRCRSGLPWSSVYLASMAARARQPRTVHCAEYPQASNWISAVTYRFLASRVAQSHSLARDLVNGEVHDKTVKVDALSASACGT